jgi:SAM-dependent methyltransferase
MILVLRLWPARVRAREAAVVEAVALLGDLGARAAAGGPLSEQPGVTWVDLPERALAAAAERAPALGYSMAVSALLPEAAAGPGDVPVRWRRQPHVLRTLHEADAGELRSRAPDRRSFLLECGDGVVRRVTGYRGGRDPLTRRALPVLDARLLVNLVQPGRGGGAGRLLDPFAGAGGVVLEARSRGWSVLSADVDPALRLGLRELGAAHVVADARALPLAAACVDAIATEPPYHPPALPAVLDAVAELRRVLRPGGRLAMLVALAQRVPVAERAAAAGLTPAVDVAIDRKGSPVAALAWVR